MHLQQVLNPDNYCSMTNSKGNIVPQITDKEAAPAYLLKENVPAQNHIETE